MEMISNKLIPVLMGFLGTIVGVIFLLLTVGALDSYSRFFDYHCFSKSEGTTAILHGHQDPSEDGPGVLATLGAGTEAAGVTPCRILTAVGEGGTDAVLTASASAATNSLTLYTEEGDPFKITAITGAATTGLTTTEIQTTGTLPSGWTWRAPLKITQELGGLSTTLVNFMPLLVTVGFLASIWGAIGVHMMDGNEGVKGLTTMLGAKIAMLVILFAAVRLAPTLVEEANATLLGLQVYSITFEYDTLQDLMFGFVPIIVTIGIIGFALYDSVRLVSRVQGMGGFSAMKGRMMGG